MTPTAFAQTMVGRGVEERAQTTREGGAEKKLFYIYKNTQKSVSDLIYLKKYIKASSNDGQKDTKPRLYQTPNWSVFFFGRPLRARVLKIAL